MKKKKDFNDIGFDAILLICAAIFINSVRNIYNLNHTFTKREKESK